MGGVSRRLQRMRARNRETLHDRSCEVDFLGERLTFSPTLGSAQQVVLETGKDPVEAAGRIFTQTGRMEMRGVQMIVRDRENLEEYVAGATLLEALGGSATKEQLETFTTGNADQKANSLIDAMGGLDKLLELVTGSVSAEGLFDIYLVLACGFLSYDKGMTVAEIQELLPSPGEVLEMWAKVRPTVEAWFKRIPSPPADDSMEADLKERNAPEEEIKKKLRSSRSSR